MDCIAREGGVGRWGGRVWGRLEECYGYSKSCKQKDRQTGRKADERHKHIQTDRQTDTCTDGRTQWQTDVGQHEAKKTGKEAYMSTHFCVHDRLRSSIAIVISRICTQRYA
jgi:hypothetical protein